MSEARLATFLVPLSLWLGACQTSFHLREATQSALAGNYAQALASCRLGFSSSRPRGGPAQHASWAEECADAQLRYVESEVTRLSALKQKAQTHRGLWALLQLYRRPLWHPPENAKTKRYKATIEKGYRLALSAMAAHIASRQDELDALNVAGQHYAAVKRAYSLLSPLESSNELYAQLLERARAPGRTFHQARAQAADMRGAQVFHERLAMLFGAPAPQGPSLKPLISVRYRVRFTGQPCEWAEKVIEERLGQATGPEEALIEINIQRCLRDEREHIETKTVRYIKKTPQQRSVRENYYEQTPLPEDCGKVACKRYDFSGVCIKRGEVPKRCRPKPPVLKTRDVPRVVYTDRPETLKAKVFKRKLQVMLQGTARLKLGSLVDQWAINIHKKHEDPIYWTPTEFRYSDGTTLDSLANQAVEQLGVDTQRLTKHLREQRLRHLYGLALRDLKENKTLQAESILYPMGRQSSSKQRSARQILMQRYQLDHRAERVVFDGGVQLGFARGGAPQVSLPRPTQARWLERQERWMTRRAASAGALERIATEEGEDGMIELGFKLSTSPLRSAGRAHGLGGALYAWPVELSFGFENDLLGGQVEGFDVGMRGFAELMDDAELVLAFGLKYAQQISVDDERYRNFAITGGLLFSLSSWLYAEVGIDMNLLLLKRATDPSDNDPHFFWPVYVRMTAQLGPHIFGSIGATHYLGVGGREPLHVDGRLGVRF